MTATHLLPAPRFFLPTGNAMLWLALLAGVLMDVLVKLLGGSEAGAGVGVAVTVAWRWAFGLLVLLPLALFTFTRHDWTPWRHVHAQRALLNLFCTYALVLGLQQLPLALVMTIFFAEPLLMLLLAALIGRQALPRRQLLVCVVGLLGVALATYGDWHRAGPANEPLLLAALIAVLGAAAGALQTVLTQRHGGDVSSRSLVFWTSVSATAVALPLAGPAAWALSPGQAGLLLGVGALGTAFSLLWVGALKRVPARVAAHVLYLTLPLGALAGWWWFDETPHAVSVLGSLCVFAAVLVLERLDARRAAHERRAAPLPTPRSAPVQAGG